MLLVFVFNTGGNVTDPWVTAASIAAYMFLGGAAGLLAREVRLCVVPKRSVAWRVEELDVVAEIKADFAVAVTHELRTPVTTILGATEVLLDEDAGELTADQRRLLESLERNGHRLASLVDDLVALFAVQTDTADPMPEVDLAEVVVKAWAAHRHAMEARGARVRLTGHTKDLVVRGNATLLMHAVSHLISNALRFSPDPAHIHLSLDRGDADNGLIRVSDQGHGIPPCDLPFVFESFYRGAHSLRLPTPGAGMGLAVAKAVVTAHHGTVTLTSEPARGTTVTISLPLARVPRTP